MEDTAVLDRGSLYCCHRLNTTQMSPSGTIINILKCSNYIVYTNRGPRGSIGAQWRALAARESINTGRAAPGITRKDVKY